MGSLRCFSSSLSNLRHFALCIYFFHLISHPIFLPKSASWFYCSKSFPNIARAALLFSLRFWRAEADGSVREGRDHGLGRQAVPGGDDKRASSHERENPGDFFLTKCLEKFYHDFPNEFCRNYFLKWGHFPNKMSEEILPRFPQWILSKLFPQMGKFLWNCVFGFGFSMIVQIFVPETPGNA